MEPIVVAVIACTVGGLVSAFAGASLFSAAWRVFNKDLAKVMDAVRKGGGD